jgi:hypothetical protein
MCTTCFYIHNCACRSLFNLRASFDSQNTELNIPMFIKVLTLTMECDVFSYKYKSLIYIFRTRILHFKGFTSNLFLCKPSHMQSSVIGSLCSHSHLIVLVPVIIQVLFIDAIIIIISDGGNFTVSTMYGILKLDISVTNFMLNIILQHRSLS